MKILIADDHAIVRKGLIELLKEEYPKAVISEASNSAEAIIKVHQSDWDLILMDISMPGRNGLETLKQMRSEGLKTPILMLSMHPEGQYAVRVLKAGASGFVNKDSAVDELIKAVRKVMLGKKYITPTLAEKLINQIGNVGEKPIHETLSDREYQTLLLIGSGKSVSQIAEELSLSVSTLSTYRSRILEKMGMRNNAELVSYVIKNDLE